MSKNTFKWLGLVVLSFATLLVMGGCGGGGSSPAATPVAKVSGTVTFPTTASVSLTSLGKRVSKSVALTLPDTTIELRDLTGKVIATTTAVATASGTYEYSFPDVPLADYVVRAVRGTTVMKAIVDKGSLTADTIKTRNVDTASTTAVVVAEQKMGATPGTIGETITTANAASAAKITSDLIASISPQALENAVYNAIGTVTGSAPASATSNDIALMNLINIITAAVMNNLNPTAIVSGTVAPPPTMITTQYTAANVATGGATNVVIEQATVTTTASATTQLVYVVPPADSVAFTSKVMDYSTSPATPLAGVEVTSIGLSSVIKTFTDPNGYYTLVGVAKSTPFFVKMSKTGNADTYSAQLTLAANTDTSDRPYASWTLTKFAADYSTPTGTGVISSRVVINTNLVSGYMSGVVVTATDSADQTTHTATYFNQNTQKWDPTLTSTDVNGRWMFNDVPAGTTGTVTATKAGYTFNTRTFKVYADSISQGSITGTVAPVAPVDPVVVVTPPVTSSSALLASLQAGWYEFRSDNSYDSSTNTSTNYYYVERMGLASDGVTMTKSTPSYFDRVSKTWVSTKPAGFPTNNSVDYALSPSGVWILDDSPQGMTAVFNADGTARLTNPKSGEIVDVSVTTVDLTGKAITADAVDFAPLLATATAFPSGSVSYQLNVTSLTDGYQLWNSYPNLTSLAAVPAALAESSTSGMSIYFENISRTEYYYGRFVDGSTTLVNVYQGIQNGTTMPTKVGQATASTSTVLGQQIMEIVAPATLKTTYGLTQNAIFAVNGGVVMQGTHSPIGPDPNKGGFIYNDIAINHMKASINTALAKPVLAKKLSKAILGW